MFASSSWFRNYFLFTIKRQLSSLLCPTRHLPHHSIRIDIGQSWRQPTALHQSTFSFETTHKTGYSQMRTDMFIEVFVTKKRFTYSTDFKHLSRDLSVQTATRFPDIFKCQLIWTILALKPTCPNLIDHSPHVPPLELKLSVTIPYNPALS